MQPRKGHTWAEKLESPAEPRIVRIPEHWAQTIGRGRMLILTPRIIQQFLYKIPKGKIVTVNLIREKFAREYHVETTCPLTTGIFLKIAAEVSEEDAAAGKNSIAPYWRVLREGGKLNQKYPGGVSRQAEHLRSEGLEVSEGKAETSWKVKRYAENLMIDQLDEEKHLNH